MDEKEMIVLEDIQKWIFNIRGVQVTIDNDLAELHGVEIKYLYRAIKRNMERFQDKYMFKLTREEYERIKFQDVTIETGRGKHRKYLPYTFTELKKEFEEQLKKEARLNVLILEKCEKVKLK